MTLIRFVRREDKGEVVLNTAQIVEIIFSPRSGVINIYTTSGDKPIVLNLKEVDIVFEDDIVSTFQSWASWVQRLKTANK